MPDMVRFGRAVRALRRRRKWRQLDLAAAAHVSREQVSRVERGMGEPCSVRDLDRIAQALGARTSLRLDWNGEALDRLLDADHARIVEAVVRYLRAAGWDVATEVTFAIGAERGSVDVLARHPASAMILIVEVKSVGESRTSRRRVEAHHETFALKFPDRIAAIRRWIARPDPKRPLRGLWFLPVERPARHRVRNPDS